jgi:hypothetical protein
MKRKRFTEEQIISILNELEAEARLPDLPWLIMSVSRAYSSASPNTGHGSLRGQAA